MTELQEVIEAADEHVPASPWAWLSEALPHAQVMVESDRATVEVDGAEWRSCEWSGVGGHVYGRGEVNRHDAPDVIRTVGTRASGGFRWEVSRLLADGIYARARGETETLVDAMNLALREPLAPDVRDGVEWYQDRAGSVAVVAGARWGVARLGEAWYFVRQITEPAVVAAINQLRLLINDRWSSGCEPGELRGPAATREEAEQACATAVQRLRAAAAAILGVVDHAESGDDFQRGWTRGRRELQATIGALLVGDREVEVKPA